jgi:hypothetical protein
MDLYLQFGHGMMEHSRHLIGAWGGGTVILSPRDLDRAQLQRMADDLRRKNGRVLLDPQFYLPHADHKRLLAHDYWPKSYEQSHSISSGEWSRLLEKIFALNDALGSESIILPGVLLKDPDRIEEWTRQVHDMFQELPDRRGASSPLIATVALSDTATRDADVVHLVIDELRGWPVAGVYVVCQPPRGDYLVTDPMWLANVLDLVAGARLCGRIAILGYCTHQMLVAVSAGATAIASGTWMNVRSFPPEKFKQDEDELRRRGIWYYCPQALSEYTVPFLDIAGRQGLLDLMKPAPPTTSTYTKALFEFPSPSTAPFSEQDVFRHYLDCLARQTRDARRSTYSGTMTAGRDAIETASNLVARLSAAGVRGAGREFRLDVAQATESALSVLDAERGPMLERNWLRLQ